MLVYLLACAGLWTVFVPALVAARQRRLKIGAITFALLPLYYGLVSLAAWAAIVDLIVRPHFGRGPNTRARAESPSGPASGKTFGLDGARNCRCPGSDRYEMGAMPEVKARH